MPRGSQMINDEERLSGRNDRGLLVLNQLNCRSWGTGKSRVVQLLSSSQHHHDRLPYVSLPLCPPLEVAVR